MKRNLAYLAATVVCIGLFLAWAFVAKNQTDTKPPVISFKEEMPEISALEQKTALLRGVTAYDDTNGDVTDSLVVASIRLSDTEGMVQVTYAAFDAAGNVAKAVRQVVYKDYESPKFSLSNSLTFVQNHSVDIFNIVHAQDMFDGDISHRVRITLLEGDTITTVGEHLVELKVTNSLGETVCLAVPVEVYTSGIYAGTLTLTDYIVYLPATEELDAESYLDTYIRNGVSVSLEEDLPAGYSLEIKNNVQQGVPGVYTVEYRVTQTVGVGENAQNYTGYARLIVVVEG